MDVQPINIEESKKVENVWLNNNTELSSNKKQIKYYLYCISCFNKEIWNSKSYNLSYLNPEIISIETISEKELFYDQKYIVIIHKINLNDKVKKLNLILKHQNYHQYWNLNEITIKPDKEKIIFADLEININYLSDFLKFFKDNCKEEKNIIDIKQKVSRILSPEEKFNIYKNYIIKNKLENELKSNLVSQFLSTLKDDNEVIYSDTIEIFNLSFGTKVIVNFLDKYTKLNYNLNQKIENKEFNKILELYKNDKNKFFSKNEIFFKKIKIDEKENINPVQKYKKLLEDYITIYQLFYGKPENIEKQQLINVKSTLLTILNKKTDLIKYLSFIEFKFDAFYKVLSLNPSEKIKIKSSLLENKEIFFINFENIYNLLLKEQETKENFILDFSEIFNYFLDHSNTFSELFKLKKLYKKELHIIPNKYFENKIGILIHNAGYKDIQNGQYDNIYLMKFIKTDDIFFTKKDNKEKFKILKWFKIELMNEDFFKSYNKAKIYYYFEDDYYVPFLKGFFDQITEIKYFGLFFKLLPFELYNKESINYIVKWLRENIKNFILEKCPNFQKEIKNFFELCGYKKLISGIYNTLDILKQNLNEYNIDLFIFLINEIGNNLNSKILESMIEFLLFHNNKDDRYCIIPNLDLFFNKIKQNKTIAKIVLNNLQNYSIIYTDFFEEENANFRIFETLLTKNDYSVLSDDSYKNISYWQNTIDTCSALYKDLKNLNLIFFKVKNNFNMIGEKNIQKRIKNIIKCLDEEDYRVKAISVKSSIYEVLNEWKENTKKIENLKNYNIFIYEECSAINEELSIYNKKIFESSLQYLKSEKAKKEFSKFERDIQKAKQLSELKKSNVFLNIFNETKNTTESKKLLEEVIKKFNNIKKIFVNDKEIIKVELKKNKEIKHLINIGYQSESNLKKEIDYLLKYFNINNFKNKDFLIERFKIIVENKSLFSVISGILHLFDIYENILNLNDNENIEFYKEFNEYKKLLKTKEYIPDEKIQNIVLSIENRFNINFINQEKKMKFFNLFIAINQYPKSIEFLKDKKLDQVRNLNEFLLESDDTPLNDTDINDFIYIVSFFEDIITKKQKYHTFFNFVQKVNQEILEDNKHEKSIINYIEKYNQIKTLFSKYLNHTEGCIKKIKNILNESNFTLSLNDEKTSYCLKGSYLNLSINNDPIINKEENNELQYKTQNYYFIFYKDLETIHQRIYIAKIPESYKDSVDIFKNFFQNIENIINILNTLYVKGYHEEFQLILKFKETKLTCINEENQEFNIESLKKYFTALKDEVFNLSKNFYYKSKFLQFFYGRQLNFIYNNIINKNEIKNLELFKVSSNNNIQSLKLNTFNLGLISSKKMKNYGNILQQMHFYIEKQFEFNKKKINDIYEKNKIQLIKKPLQSKNIENKNKDKKANEYKGFYFYMTYKNQEIESLSLYFFLTKNLPINNCFLYCNKDTNDEELRTFLIRCVSCEDNALFCMVNANLLNSKEQRKFHNLIKNFARQFGKKMESCLIIIFSDKENDLHKKLLKTQNIDAFPDPIYFSYPFEFDPEYKKNYKLYLIKSNNCGLGKSEFIKNQKNNENINKKAKDKINYIYFPLGGQFTRNNLIQRIMDLPDMSDINTKFSIHFDITQTKEIELLNEFFFKLLILRKCDLNENAKYFGQNVEIIIEVPNDFTDYINEIQILSKIKEENINKINKINYSPELDTVAKILTMYESNDILKKQSEINKINLKLSEEDCQNIILKYIKHIKVDNPNYFQVNIFIKVLSDQFSKFLKCNGYTVETLVNNAIARGMTKEDALNIINLRKFIIYSLVQVTKLFLIGPYENLIKSQRINQKLMNEGEEEKSILINKQLSIEIDSVSFDKIKPSLVVFNKDGNSCTIITTCEEKESEFKNLNNLYNSQNISIKNNETLRNFRKLNNNEILENLLRFLNVSSLTSEQKKAILGTYVYTPDNFIKVVLILLRIRAKIPIIMMGETGCGKTTLIEMASKLINKGKISIKKMNIHAGIVDEDIIKFMNEVDEEVKTEDKIMLKERKKEFNSQSEENKKAYLKKFSIEKIYSEYEEDIKNRNIWIFFDEINTCNSMGLLIEIFCKNSIYGRPLDKRYIYIGACNPYRVASKESKDFNILYKKQQKKKHLVYTVNPLPFSLLNFVFNFGSLKDEDELKYIESMIIGTTDKIFEKLKIEKLVNEKEKIINTQKTSVKICQKFMKKNNDISIVSLREVNRFNIFFEFFVDYIIKRKNNKNLLQNTFEEEEIINYYNSKSEIQILYSAINLSLFVCYYLRLPHKDSRNYLKEELNETKFFSEDFLKIPLMEEKYILNNFDIPQGIAKNRNLRENVFILFICIINKIPLITCGKPGRSKTLSFRIIQKSMKGEASKTLFCRQYPEVVTFQIQGSLSTTSSEILDIFKKGRNHQKNNLKKNVVIFMDEMGLAEISENNPLKVMHSELEQETDKVSFVGISNWFIDASKMNRVIYNVVQDPDENDIIETGREIGKSYEVNGDNYSKKYEDIIIRLSKAYYKFITKKKDENDKDQYFHGSRDYYCLIRSVLNDIKKNKVKLDNESDENEYNKILNNICLNNIMRNFGGLENSIEEFTSYFLEGNERINYLNNVEKDNNYNLMKCIQENINDENSRYLLLIPDSYLSQEILNTILEEIKENKNDFKSYNNYINVENKDKDGIEIFNKNNLKKEMYKKYYCGSKFKGDRNDIIYYNKMLNKIKYQMETKNILILKDLDFVYPALYDLFNQSFINFNRKKFVHLGQSKSLSLVDDNFKIIVLVDKDKIQNQEPPFLNRFEKHIINLSNLLNKELLNLAEEIYNTLKEINKIIITDNNNNKIVIQKKFKKYLNFINEEEIKGLIYLAYKRKKNEIIDIKNNKNYIIQFVLEKIAPYFTEELMILFSKFGFMNKYNFYYKCIYETYKEKYCYNIKNYLEKLNNEISVVYTFSSFFDEIINDENEKIINNSIEFSKDNTAEIYINSISTMDQIDKEFIDFIFDNKTKKNLLILKFREEDLNKLNDIYYLLNDYKTNIGKKALYRQSKFVIFIIYLEKNSDNNTCMSFLSNYPQIMIKNFYNKHKNFPEILISSNKEIIQKDIFDINSIIDNNIDDVLRFFNFELLNCDSQQNICYKQTISFFMKTNNYIKNLFKIILTTLIKNDQDFVIKIFNEEMFKNQIIEDINIMSLLFDFISSLIFNELRKIIFLLEKEQIISSLAFDDTLSQNELIKKYIYDFVSKIDNFQNNKFNWKTKNINQQIKIEILLEQKLPLCGKFLNSLLIYSQNNIANKYLERDSYFFNTRIKDSNIENELNKYKTEIKKLNNNLKIELSKYKIIIDILNSKNEKLISNLFEDSFYIFIKKSNKLKYSYSNLSKLLNLIIQLRLKTRLNDNLNIDFIQNEKIELYTSFIDIIKEEDKDNEERFLENNENNIIEKNKYINKFVDIINFLQGYSKEIYIILEVYYFLLENIPSVYEKILLIIQEKKVEMEKDPKRNPYCSIINKVSFFYVIESMCKILKEHLLNSLNCFDYRNYQKKFQFFKSIQYLIQNILKLEKRFLLFSKEIFSLDIIIKIISQILLKKNYNILELSIETLNLFLTDYKNKNLVEIIHGQNIMLFKLFKDKSDEYAYLMNKVLLNHYKSESSPDTKEKIIENFFLQQNPFYNDKLMEYSYPLMKVIFKFQTLEPIFNENQKNKFYENFSVEDKIKSIINEKINPKLSEIFLYRFEIICNNYFKKIEKSSEKNDSRIYKKLCGGLSKNYLEFATKTFYKNFEKGISLNNLYKLYCIAYIKIYLNYYIDILYVKEKSLQFPESNEVNDILFQNKVKNKNTIVYYWLKLLLQKTKNWENFIKYYKELVNTEADIFGFKKNDIKIKLDEDVSFIITPILLIDHQKKINLEYNELLSKNTFNVNDQKLFSNLFLKDKSYDYLYTFISNVILLYHSTNSKNIEKKNNYKNLLILINKNLNLENLSLDKKILSFFNLFFDEKKFKEILNKKIGISEAEEEKDKITKISILLYGLRFVFSILLYAKDGLYLNLLSKNISTIIESSFIPGNFIYDSLKIQSFYEIQKLLRANQYNYGAYLCSCGYHYTIDKCTFPTYEFKCPICKQMIGGKKHILVRREGHVRVFYDRESRKIKLKHSYADKNIPNILLPDLEKQINLEKNQLLKGINPIEKEVFEKNQENVREMNEMTYRFLNFVLYSILFYSNIEGFIKDKYLKKYLINNMSCFEIMEKNWGIIYTLLENIPVETFLNLIFPEIIQKFINCGLFKISEDAINYEKSINEFINNKIQNNKLLHELKKRNDDLINVNPNSDKIIIQEMFPYNKYSENEIPDFKYFYLSEFPSKEHFILKFNSREQNKEKYPILNAIINNDKLKEKLTLMKYLPKINKICNYMINYVSFKYTREEAKTILIKDEIKETEIITLLNEFVSIYKKIRPFITQQGCHEFGELFLDIEYDLYLANLCVDSGELGFGLVLLAMYEEMAEWQNTFISTVVNSTNEHLNYYKDLFDSKIMIQDCEEEYILELPTLDSNFKPTKEKQFNLYEIILDNSSRKDNKILYNYDEIEDELASNILPKIKAFKTEYRKVIYQYECFVGDRSSIIITFMERYPQRELNDKELQNVIKYILDKKKKNINYDIKNLMISLQVLIDVILDSSPNLNITLSHFIESDGNIPNIDIIKDFIKTIKENIQTDNYNEIDNGNYYTIDTLISLIDIVELFCWENIKKNLDKKYLLEIHTDIKTMIVNNLNNVNEEGENNIIINKIDLCSAIRKFITRYLSGKSDESINPKNELKNYLINIELWPINYAETEIIDEEINKIFYNINIEISQAEKLYEYLGGDISKINEIIKKYEDKQKKKLPEKKIKIENHDYENPNKIIEDEKEVENNNINNIETDKLSEKDEDEVHDKVSDDIPDEDSENEEIGYE